MFKATKKLSTLCLVALCALVQAVPSVAAADGVRRILPARERPNEPQSDGPTLYYKHMISRSRNPARALGSAQRRSLGIKQGEELGIGIRDDMKHTLHGFGGVAGLISTLNQQAPHADNGDKTHKALVKAAHGSRDRVKQLLAAHNVDAAQTNKLAELIVWQNLAYQSSSLAHGSFAPDGSADPDVQQKAQKGLEAAIGESFKLGKKYLGGKAPVWSDVEHLHRTGVQEIASDPRYWFVEPGQVRKLDMESRFGARWQLLHGDKGLVGQMGAHLEKQANQLKTEPLAYMGKALFQLHNNHVFRDGNGRLEVTDGWALAKGAGFPLPIRYDQQAGSFKLAAAKWGGTTHDMTEFLARGALATELFARRFLKLTKGAKIVSNHTDHGAVATVIQHKDGRKELLVMFPVNHATKMDPELKAEAAKNRVVVVADQLDPKDIKINIAINGRQNPWKAVGPQDTVTWAKRYPWWNTFEPIYRVALPTDASFVNFKVEHRGTQLGHTTGDYYMNLAGYKDINQRMN